MQTIVVLRSATWMQQLTLVEKQTNTRVGWDRLRRKLSLSRKYTTLTLTTDADYW